MIVDCHNFYWTVTVTVLYCLFPVSVYLYHAWVCKSVSIFYFNWSLSHWINDNWELLLVVLETWLVLIFDWRFIPVMKLMKPCSFSGHVANVSLPGSHQREDLWRQRVLLPFWRLRGRKPYNVAVGQPGIHSKGIEAKIRAIEDALEFGKVHFGCYSWWRPCWPECEGIWRCHWWWILLALPGALLNACGIHVTGRSRSVSISSMEMKEWMNEWMKWMNEWINEWMNEWKMNDCSAQ